MFVVGRMNVRLLIFYGGALLSYVAFLVVSLSSGRSTKFTRSVEKRLICLFLGGSDTECSKIGFQYPSGAAYAAYISVYRNSRK